MAPPLLAVWMPSITPVAIAPTSMPASALRTEQAHGDREDNRKRAGKQHARDGAGRWRW